MLPIMEVNLKLCALLIFTQIIRQSEKLNSDDAGSAPARSVLSHLVTETSKNAQKFTRKWIQSWVDKIRSDAK